MRYKTIHASRGYLGGYEFRAASNGESVNLQSRAAGAQTWQTKATISQAEFVAEAHHRDMWSAYGGDSPSHVYSIIEALREAQRTF